MFKLFKLIHYLSAQVVSKDNIVVGNVQGMTINQYMHMVCGNVKPGKKRSQRDRAREEQEAYQEHCKRQQHRSQAIDRARQRDTKQHNKDMYSTQGNPTSKKKSHHIGYAECDAVSIVGKWKIISPNVCHVISRFLACDTASYCEKFARDIIAKESVYPEIIRGMPLAVVLDFLSQQYAPHIFSFDEKSEKKCDDVPEKREIEEVVEKPKLHIVRPATDSSSSSSASSSSTSSTDVILVPPTSLAPVPSVPVVVPQPQIPNPVPAPVPVAVVNRQVLLGRLIRPGIKLVQGCLGTNTCSCSRRVHDIEYPLEYVETIVNHEDVDCSGEDRRPINFRSSIIGNFDTTLMHVQRATHHIDRGSDGWFLFFFILAVLFVPVTLFLHPILTLFLTCVLLTVYYLHDSSPLKVTVTPVCDRLVSGVLLDALFSNCVGENYTPGWIASELARSHCVNFPDTYHSVVNRDTANEFIYQMDEGLEQDFRSVLDGVVRAHPIQYRESAPMGFVPPNRVICRGPRVMRSRLESTSPKSFLIPVLAALIMIVVVLWGFSILKNAHSTTPIFLTTSSSHTRQSRSTEKIEKRNLQACVSELPDLFRQSDPHFSYSSEALSSILFFNTFSRCHHHKSLLSKSGSTQHLIISDVNRSCLLLGMLSHSLEMTERCAKPAYLPSTLSQEIGTELSPLLSPSPIRCSNKLDGLTLDPTFSKLTPEDGSRPWNELSMTLNLTVSNHS